MKKGLIALVCIFIFLLGQAQKKDRNQPLQKGDEVPDVTIHHIMNYPKGSAHIADFKGKLLILDFWGIYCSSCIAHMPEMEKLQEVFGDKIQVLLVTRDSRKMVEALSKKSAIVRDIRLPIVTDDTLLSHLFPYREMGLHVWIDGRSRVSQKTEESTYSAKEIQAFLNGNTVNLTERIDQPDFDAVAPLWLEGGGRQLKYIQYHSLISIHLPGVSFGGGVQKDLVTQKPIRLWRINAVIGNLYGAAFADGNHHWVRTIWEIRDSSQYFPPVDRAKIYDWELHHTWCYELQVPLEKSDQLFTMMQQDLERYFGLTGSIEKRKVLCWVLTRTTIDSLFKSRGEGKVTGRLGKKRDSIIVHNEYFNSFVTNYLRIDDFPVLDETGYAGPIDLEIPFDPRSDNHEATQAALLRYGLALKQAYRELDCLILQDIK